MKTIYKALFISIILVLGCKRPDKYEGPSLQDIYGEFTMLTPFTASKSNIDFSTGDNLYFNAKFNKPTQWTITIKGTNNARKVISGQSTAIEIGNSEWDGTASGFPLFATGNCTAELFIKADSSVHTVNIKVDGLKKPGGKVVADFESGINSGWKVFAQSGANMTFVLRDTGVIPEGKKYYDMGGRVNWDWLIGMIDFPAKAYGTKGFELSGNPDDWYFNVVLSRPVGITNGIVLFQFSEDDNMDGVFNKDNEDMYSIELKNLSPGWNIYSVKYSELVCLVNGSPATPKGNARFDMDKLFQISCLFLANPSSGFSQASMDYIVFTQGKALQL
jgi:hypothetical protein